MEGINAAKMGKLKEEIIVVNLIVYLKSKKVIKKVNINFNCIPR